MTLIQQVHDEQDLTSRVNFDGHITASAFILNPSKGTVLMLYHNGLSRFLQPGGYIDSVDDSILAACYREAKEETGLDVCDIEMHSLVKAQPVVPIDIDSHLIPYNSNKDEPAHYHHDFRYLFTTTVDEIVIDTAESSRYIWMDYERFRRDPDFTIIAAKMGSAIQLD